MKNQNSKRGKYETRKRKLRWRKQFVLLVSVVVLILGAVGGTVAYLVAEGGQVTNQFEYGKVSCKINEPGWTNGNTVKENVTVTNTGNVPAYIRAAIVVTWVKDGMIAPYAPTAEGTDPDYSIALGENWTKNGDYYYYNGKVEANATTGKLIDSLTVLNANADGYTLHVEILADAVQAEPSNVVEDVWGYTPAG